MRIFYAKYIYPVTSEIIENGAIVINEGKIIDFGNREDLDMKFQDVEERFNLRNALIMPGFVNAHTHLEFSNVKIKEVKNFQDWLLKIVSERDKMQRKNWLKKIKFLESLYDKRWKRLIKKRINEMIISGTIAIADVTNTAKLITLLLKIPLKVQIFIELIAFDEERGRSFFEAIKKSIENISQVIKKHMLEKEFKISLSAHAPYSVSETLFRLIKSFNKSSKTSVHLAEPFEEIEFMKNGTGFFRDFLIKRGAFTPGWKPPGISSVKYLDKIGFLDENTLAVHCVNVDDEDIEILSSRNVSVCICPRSNFFLKVGKAPLRKFIDNGINVCLGTDSMASNRDLNILHELKFAKEFYPNVSDEELIKIATINGAKALGFENSCGSIEKGKDADLIFFPIPDNLKKSDIYNFIFQSSACGRLS